jgi:two-component system, NtrC family, response regulator HydG
MSATILVLEDDDNLRAEVGETLEDADHQVILCASPTEAIAAAKKQPFDLFLTDVRMAGEIDGVGALAVIKQIQPKSVASS